MPSLRRFSILLFLLALLPAISCAQQPKKLKDLTEISILVEDLEQREIELGLSAEELKAVSLVALKRDLPNLKIDKSGDGMFYVNVTAARFPGGYAVHVEVSLDRRVAILREDNSEVTRALATVWSQGKVLTGTANGMSSKIYEYIREQVTILAADYYQQNKP